MTHYDPRDWGQDDPEPPRMGWEDVLLAVLWVAVVAALIGSCDAKAQIPPFEVTLPTGQVIDACGMEYDANAKALTLAPCVVVFSNGFEG